MVPAKLDEAMGDLAGGVIGLCSWSRSASQGQIHEDQGSFSLAFSHASVILSGGCGVAATSTILRRLAAVLDIRYDSGMDAIESRMIGRCEGYRPNAVFELEDGSSWVQVSKHVEYVSRDRPAVRVWRDSTGLMALDVEGTSGVVQVERYLGKRRSGLGAYSATRHPAACTSQIETGR